MRCKEQKAHALVLEPSDEDWQFTNPRSEEVWDLLCMF